MGFRGSRVQIPPSRLKWIERRKHLALRRFFVCDTDSRLSQYADEIASALSFLDSQAKEYGLVDEVLLTNPRKEKKDK